MWRGKNELRQLWVLLPSTTQQGQKWIQIVRYAHKQQTHMRAAHVDWQHLIFRVTVIPHGVTESRGMAENKERDGALARKNKSCRQPVLQGSHLQGIGNKKNRRTPRYRGNYSEDNTDGEGERMPRGRKGGYREVQRGRTEWDELQQQRSCKMCCRVAGISEWQETTLA